jgi:hypothetical protein
MAIQFNNTGTGIVTLASPSSGTVALTLPSADGTNGQVIQTNGSGVLSFVTVSGGGGSVTMSDVIAMSIALGGS